MSNNQSEEKPRAMSLVSVGDQSRGGSGSAEMGQARKEGSDEMSRGRK